MNIEAVENLSFAELKANRKKILKDLADVSAEDLAARYLQARTDAKQRDEKMLQQGEMITALQSDLQSTRNEISGLREQVAQLELGYSQSAKIMKRLKPKGRAVKKQNKRK